MRQKVQKGEWGYIADRKKRILLFSIGIIVVALIIFLVGLLLNKMSNANIFTVLAILCVLPWAKQVVALVVFFPYRSVESARYQKLEGMIEQGQTLYTDLVITSPEKVMNLDFLVIGYGQVVALVGRKGQDVPYIRRYLTEGVQRWGDYQVMVLDEEALFLKEVESMPQRDVDETEEERVKEYLLSLVV